MIFQENRIRWLQGLLAQVHACFFRCVVAFFCIAFFTGGYQVCPGIHPAAGTRRDVVDGKVFPGTAILTFIPIALEYILPGKINALVGGVDISVQADDRRHGKALGDRPEFMPVGRTYQFAFLKIYKNEGALH